MTDHPPGALRRIRRPYQTGRIVRVLDGGPDHRGRVAVRSLDTDRLSYVQPRHLEPLEGGRADAIAAMVAAGVPAKAAGILCDIRDELRADVLDQLEAEAGECEREGALNGLVRADAIRGVADRLRQRWAEPVSEGTP